MAKLVNRAKVFTSTVGTGTITLGGAVDGFQTFAAAGVSNGDVVAYVIEDGANWEIGTGTYTASGTTLTRTVSESSNSDAAISLSGDAQVYISAGKDDFLQPDNNLSDVADAATARSNLGLTIGTNVQAHDAGLDDVAGLTPTDGNFIVGNGANWVAESGATARASLGLGSMATQNANAVALTGGTISHTPTNPNDIANKQYVDNNLAYAVHYHDPVRLEVTTNLNAVYNNGTNGVGATLTNNGAQGAFGADGVFADVGDRILVYEQTNGFENGIYVVTDIGSSSTNWVLTRASDADSYAPSDPDALGAGDTFYVREGNTGAGELYTCNTQGTITFGTTNITFTQIASAAIYSATGALQIQGTTFSVKDGGINTTLLGGDITAAGKALLDDTSASAQRTTLGLGTLATQSGTFSGTSSGTNTGDQLVFKNVAVSGQSTIVADTTTDTLNVAAGTGITVTTNATTDTLTITNSAPDQTVTLTAGSNVSITGTYPDFTIASSYTDTNTTYSAGNGIGLTGTTFSVSAGGGLTQEASGLAHSDTSTQLSISNSGNTVIQGVTLDTYGHVTGLSSKSLSIPAAASDATVTISAGNGLTTGGSFTTNQSTPSTITLNVGAGTGIAVAADSVSLSHLGIQDLVDPDADRIMFWDDSASSTEWLSVGTGLSISGTQITNTAPDQTVALTGSGSVSVTGTYPNFTITGTDTNTTYTAGAGLSLTGTQFSHTDTSTQTSVNNSGNTFIQDVTLDTYGHVTGLTSAAVTIGDGAMTVTAGSGLTGGGQLGTANQTESTSVTLSHADTSAQASVNNSNGTVVQDVTLDTYGHVTALGSVNLDDRYYTETESDARYLRSDVSDQYYRISQYAHGDPINNLGDPSITEMALFQEQFDNKTAFYDINYLKFYTSTDGTNWTEYTSFSDTDKRKFLGGDYSSSINIPYNTPYFRIEILNSGSYVYLNALYMYWSGSGNSTTVKIRKQRGDGVWSQHTNSSVSLGSWPGHLYLPFSTIPFNPSTTSTGHYRTVHIDFQPTWSGTYTNAISLYRMQLWGGYPAGKRTHFTVDETKQTIFPSELYANGSTSYKVWHSGNDGASSGLDADLLDGNHASDFATASHTHDDRYYTQTQIDTRMGYTLFGSSDVPNAANGGDLNSLANDGWWKWSGSLPSNAPATYGMLVKGRDGNQEQQLVQTYGGAANQVKLFGRRKSSGTWDTSWTQYFSDHYHPNADKLTTARTISLSGDVSGSASFDGSANISITATVADNSHNHTLLTALGNYVWSASTNGRDFNLGIETSFVQEADGYPSYGSVVRVATYDNDGGTAELYFPYAASYGGSSMRYRLGQYDQAGWTGWKTVIDSDNISSQSVSSAATLTTARTINGTSFNGSANITTANWGTGRTLTIGGTGKSVNGSGNVSWTVAEVIPTTTNLQVNSLGVGTAASSTTGEIRATNNITAYYSDDRLKTKLGGIEGALEKVLGLSGFYYEANETAQAMGYEVKKEVGVSAQEVQAVMPEVVAPAPIDENYLTVRYERLVPLLIEAIKEQQEQIEELKRQLNPT